MESVLNSKILNSMSVHQGNSVSVVQKQSGRLLGRKVEILTTAQMTKTPSGKATIEFISIVKIGTATFAFIGKQTNKQASTIRNPRLLKPKLMTQYLFCIPLINPRKTSRIDRFASKEVKRNPRQPSFKRSSAFTQEPTRQASPERKSQSDSSSKKPKASSQSTTHKQTSSQETRKETSEKKSQSHSSSKKSNASHSTHTKTPAKETPEPSAADQKAHRASQASFTEKEAREVLGVNANASHSEISAAYRKLARKYHPDKNMNDPDAKAKFQEIQLSYDKLKK